MMDDEMDLDSNLTSSLSETNIKPYRAKRRCTLQGLMVISTACFIAISCILVWYVSYLYDSKALNKISHALRTQTLSHAVDQNKELMSLPILAVNELDNDAALRLVYSINNLGSRFDYSGDSIFYASIANLIRKYPGINGAMTLTGGGMFISSQLSQLNPPELIFTQQDYGTNWRSLTFYLDNYNQTLTFEQLYADLSPTTFRSGFFDTIPKAWLSYGRSHPKFNRSTRSKESYPWYIRCEQMAQVAIDKQDPSLVTSLWLLPTSNQLDSSSLIVCQPRINWNPDPDELLLVALQAQASRAPDHPLLMERAILAKQAALLNKTYPIVNYVSAVSYSAIAITRFLSNRLNSYVTDHGAAFLLTADRIMVACTLSGLDDGKLISIDNLHGKYENITRTDSVNGYLTAIHSILHSLEYDLSKYGFLWSINTTGRHTDINEAESVISVRQRSYYVQLAIIGNNWSDPGFLLLVFSDRETYNGPMKEAWLITGLSSMIVVFVTSIFLYWWSRVLTIPMTQLVRTMQQILDGQQKPISPSNSIIKRRQSIQGWFTRWKKKSNNYENQEDLLSTNTNVTIETSSITEDEEVNHTKLIARNLRGWCTLMHMHGVEVPDTWISLYTQLDDENVPESPLPTKQVPQYSTFAKLMGHLDEICLTEETFGCLLYDLLQSQHKAQAAHVMKKNVIRYLAHESRIIVNAINLALESLLESANETRSLFPSSFDGSTTTIVCSPVSPRSLNQMRKMSQSSSESSFSNCQVAESYIFPELPPSRELQMITSEPMFEPYNMLKIMKQQITGLIQILNDVLTFERIEDGCFEMDHARFDLRALIDRIVIEFWSEMRKKSLTCVVETFLRNNANESFVAVDLNEVNDGIWLVEGDEHRLRQVVCNLLSNACKFSRKNGRIRIVLTRTPRLQPPPLVRLNSQLPGLLSTNGSSPTNIQTKRKMKMPRSPPPRKGHDRTTNEIEMHEKASFAIAEGKEISHQWLDITLSVIDEGSGMSLDEQKHLFQPYSQIRAGSQQQGGGSGLGLNISRRVVEIHGGRICVESETGKGSSFIVSLPMKQMVVSPVSISRRVPLSPISVHEEFNVDLMQETWQRERAIPDTNNILNTASTFVTPRRPLVMVVEDSEVNMKLMTMILRKQDCDVLQAFDGQECVDQINALLQERKPTPDLIFMDQNMPNMSGTDAIKILRNQFGLHKIKIIGVTGNSFDKEFFQAGANQVILKPINVTKIREFLQCIPSYPEQSLAL